MSTSFYLFDVDHGQSAALLLPNSRWCVFDVGCTSAFSPVQWIAATDQTSLMRRAFGGSSSFHFLKGTVSHLHGDHLADYRNMLKYGSQLLFSVKPDQDYLADCYATCSDDSGKRLVHGFAQHYASLKAGNGPMNFSGVQITELHLPVEVARRIGGDANSRVNNASVVTRINASGTSILLCGDMEKEAWEAIIKDTGYYGWIWRPFLSNIDILVAPHHGHRSGYSTALLNLAKPAIVLASVVSKDPNVDSRYSQDPVRGIRIGETAYTLITTRKQGHIKVEIRPPVLGQSKGVTCWTFGEQSLSKH